MATSTIEGTVFDIQRYCVHDGPGIRTTVFMKGCSLRCFWCHNPESLSPRPQLITYPHKCIGCGKCAVVCPNKCFGEAAGPSALDRRKCAACGICAKTCYAGALVMSGKKHTVDQVIKQVLMDAVFYKNSGGGMTCSGGEPLVQSDFISALFSAARENGVHTALDTAGNVDFSAFEKTLPWTDLVLFDFKAADPGLHEQGTGSGNERILANLERLAGTEDFHIPVWIRIPVIPGFNNTRENMQKTAAFLKNLVQVRRLDLLPYHQLGASKYEGLGINYGHKDLTPPDKSEMKALAAVFADAHYTVEVG
ncbi:MAG: glycyl-radical enzyme activating protein [Treponema sp.]|nr:glycyl-radical enzyme activating protein [Treponema sp.]